MHWRTSLCAVAVLLGAPSAHAADLGPKIRVELAGDVVARDSLERIVAGWSGSADDKGIQDLNRAVVQQLVAEGYVGAQTNGVLRDGRLWMMIQVKRLGSLSVSPSLGGRRPAARLRVLEALCGDAAGCAHPFVNLQILESVGRALRAETGVDLHVDLRPSPGQPDSFDMMLAAPRRTRLEATLDNYGMSSTGRYRAGVTVQGDNLLAAGDSATVQAKYTGKGLTMASAVLTTPLPWRSLRLGLTASHLSYALGGDYEALGYSGRANELGVSVSGPLASGTRLKINAQGGASWKSTSNTIAAFDAGSATRNLVAVAALSGAWKWDGGGVSQFNAGLEAGRLRLLDDRARLFDALTARTEGGYGRLTFNVQHDQPLRDGLMLTARLRGALASRNLDSSEKFVLTGPDAARAFTAGRLTADDAVLGVLEVRSAVKLIGRPASVAVFGEAGGGRVNHTPWAGYGGAPDVRIADGGVSLGVSLGQRLSGELTAATELGAPQVSGRRSRLISFSLSGDY